MVHEAQGQLVQDLAGGGAAPPSRYVLREKDRPSPPSNDVIIPTVDVSRLDDDGEEELAKLRSALRTWGIFEVSGHGVPVGLLDEVLDAGREFFHLPTEVKRRYSNVVVVGDGGEREYGNEGYGVDRVDSDEQILDWCDRLYLQVLPEHDRRLRFWPPSIRDVLHEYSMKIEELSKVVLRGMAMALKQLNNNINNEDLFLNKIGTSYARFTYYPPCPRPELVHGLKPHTDGSVITLLLLDNHDVGGLQVLLRDDDGENKWVDVVGDDDRRLLVVVGDEAEIITNGAFRAALHRVVASEGRERVSLAAFFFYPAVEGSVLEPAAAMEVGGDQPRFRKIDARAFSDGFWDAFARGETTIDFLNLNLKDEEEEEGRP